MGLFSNLFEVGSVLTDEWAPHVTGLVQSDDVQVGAPLDDGIEDGKVRLTLLWLTPDPTHRNDPWEPTPDGKREPPPLTLRAYYLLTCYGVEQTTEQPAIAHRVLGKILQAIHARPTLEYSPTSLPDAGTQTVDVVQLPLEHEKVEKLFSMMQVKHQPFAFLEVGPVQLEHLEDAADIAGRVLPGGINLGGPSVATRPSVSRIAPALQVAGGKIALEGQFPEPTRVFFAGAEVDSNDVSVSSDRRRLEVVLDDGSSGPSPGMHQFTVAAGETSSRPEYVTVVSDDVPALDALSGGVIDASGSGPAAVILTGNALGAASGVVIWPDGRPTSSGDFQQLSLDSVSATQLEVLTSEFHSLRAGTYRLSAKLGPRHFTPPIIVEVQR